MTATTRITSPFGFDSTAADVIAGIDLTGRRAIVTGGSSGIGIETARALAGAGAEVTLAVRDTTAGARVAADVGAAGVGHLELADLASVAAFVDAWQGPLDILVNNAGVSGIPERELSADGWEMHLATNHLGHFALALGLHDALAAAGNARVVSLSSVASLISPVVFDDLHFAWRPYDPMLAYGQSKTATALFAVEATRRWAGDGITVNALHPGAILTNLTRHTDPDVLAQVVASGVYTFKTPEQGAATSVFVATSPLLEGIGGRYFENSNEAEPAAPGDTDAGVAPYALDPANAARLWEVSLQGQAGG